MRGQRVGERTRSVASTSALSLLAGSLVFAAVTSEGYRTTSTDLHDGTVWTIDRDRDAVLRINARINEFDTRIRQEMEGTQLLQDGTAVYLQGLEGVAQLNSTGTSIATGIEFAEFPAGSQFGVGGGVSAALVPDGRLWVTAAAALSAIDPTITEPTAELNPGSRLVVTPDGYVVGLDPVDDTVFVAESRIGEAGPGEEPIVLREPVPFGHDLPEPGDTADDFAVTAVGPTAVVMSGGELLQQGVDAPIPLPDGGRSARLQQPGIAAAEVLVADAEGVWLVPIGRNEFELRVGDGAGRPARPVVVGGCAYAGWEEIGRIWRSCAGRDEVEWFDAADPAGSGWVFRVNRSQVVLEAAGAAPLHITDAGVVPIDNWKDFESDLDQLDEDTTEEVPDQREEAVCQEVPGSPEANDDRYGATPGVSSVLRVLDNDRDPNCDPIAILPLGDWNEAWGRIDLIEQRQAFQYTPPIDPVSFSFTYRINDGRGGEASATVRIESGEGANRPPQPKLGRVSETVVEMFRSVTYNVLLDWEDPDGDSLLLENALLQGADDGSLTWSRDGTITYTASDTIAGPKVIDVAVSDGFGNRTAGTLNVSVQGEGVPLPPTARDDYVEAPAGRDQIVAPLLNDTDPNNDLLVLGRYDVPDGLLVSQGEGGTLRVRAEAAGTYLIPYEASDGALLDSATIRFEATAPDQEQQPPVAVRDSVVIREGTSLNVDVLANDYDADGDVLIITDARLQRSDLAGVSVAAIDRRYVRVQVDQDPSEPIIVEYEVSDGLSADQVGQLVVNVTPAAEQQRQGPIAGADSARVRVNDVVDIAILDNDIDPDGGELTILSATLDPPEQPGVLWLAGRTLRYRAGSEPGRVTAKYTIDDDPSNPGLNSASGFVEITVIDADPDRNLPPTPPPLEGRVFAGSSIIIPLPGTGMDPDGDSVRVVEIGPSPAPDLRFASLGVPTPLRDGIRYEASPGAQGQDVFTYEVEDTYGARAVGVVRVVVVDAPNHPMVAVPDTSRVRPGRLLQVPVLSNDTDPDGDPLYLESVDGPPELGVTINGSRVEVSVPEAVAETRWQLYYTASDGRGPPQTQVLEIIADPEAPLIPPVTRDDPDREDPDPEPVQQPDGSWTVTIDVIENDDDPDGSRDSLVVDVPLGQVVDATIVPGTGRLRIVLTDAPQSFVYSATDFDDNTSYALVRVPRAPAIEEVNLPPELRPDLTPITVLEGEPTSIAVDGYVIDPDGDPVQLAGETPTSAQGEVGVSENDFERFTFVAGAFEGADATIFVPVTDRPGEPEFTVVLPFPVIVEKPNEPPTTDPYPISVEELGDAPPVDLVASGAVSDPEGDPLRFELVEGGVAGLDVSLSPDGRVTARADGAPEGLVATYSYTVTDGQPERAPVGGSFTVTVVASTRPLVQLSPISRTDIRQGVAEVVAPLEGVANPFPDVPLTIIGAELVGGSGVVTHDARSVTFTPPDDYFGLAEVRYTVEDATGNPSRHATGSITYTVIGRPLAPGQPRVTEVASHTATIEWVPADPQGSPITDYTVYWSGGQISSGGATNVTISSLTNNTPYSFRVSATNAVGESELSNPSQEVIPDEVPQTPAPPRVVDFGDGTLSVEWDEAIVDGSPVFQYYLTVSGGETRTFGGSDRATIWEGLTNGTEYTFSLVAENNAGRSEPSLQSNPLSPAREPEAPSQPTATDVGNELVAEVLVEWNRPVNNGRDIESYEIIVNATGEVFTSNVENIRIQLQPGQNSTFTVRAQNVVGFSASSPASAEFESIIAPVAPSTPATEQRDRRIWVSSPAPAADGGDPITRYEYTLNGGAWTNLGGATAEIGGLTNGSTYSVAVRACNKKFCSQASSTVSGLVPFGPPSTPSVGVTRLNATTGRFCWSAGASNGRPLARFEWRVGSGGWNSDAPGGSNCTDQGGSFPGSVTVTVRAVDTEGQVSGSDSATITMQDTRSVTLSRGSIYNSSSGSCSPGECAFVVLTYSGFTPGSYYVYCDTGIAGYERGDTFSFGSSGTWSGQWIYGEVGSLRCRISDKWSNTLNPWKNW